MPHPETDRFVEIVATIREDVATSSLGHFCSAVAAHMLALHRALAAQQGARAWGNRDAIQAADEAVALHCARVTRHVRGYRDAGLRIEFIRGAFAAFSPAAVAALAVAMPELVDRATALLDASEDAPRPLSGPLATGGAPEDRVLAVIARKGRGGATKTNLLNALGHSLNARVIGTALDKLKIEGSITSITTRPVGSGRPAPRYFMGSGPFVVGADGSPMLAHVEPRGRSGGG